MTAQKTKPTQKRLNNCVLSPLRWAKIYEKLENCACGTLKIKDAVANAAVRVANAPKKGQTRHNTTLLGKCRIKFRNQNVRVYSMAILEHEASMPFDRVDFVPPVERDDPCGAFQGGIYRED
jgi:hypothetical protein